LNLKRGEDMVDLEVDERIILKWIRNNWVCCGTYSLCFLVVGWNLDVTFIACAF
jgi:hypothetical protein